MYERADNEVWSYGEEVEGICTKYLKLRERLRGYIRGLMEEASQKGTPVMRTLFFEFPADGAAWEVEDQYMFGAKYLCAPVLEMGCRKRTVYLPKANGVKWRVFDQSEKASQDGEVFEGGQTVEVDCPLDNMPVFERLE